MDLEAWSTRLKVFADATRVRLLALLASEELTVAELSSVTQLAQPRVSTHLAKLKDAGLVRDRRAGVSAYYRFDEANLDATQRELWRSLRVNELQLVSTDHCPFCFKEQKEMGRDDFRAIPNGIGSVEHRVNLLYQGAGWLEGGLTASYEKLIIDAEILQMMSEVLQPLPVDEASLGFDAMVDVGPGGHFFGTAHTLERYETAFYRPLLSDWRNFETWQEDGARTATERANAIWKQLLADAQPPALDAAVADALDAYVVRRRAEIARA